MISPAFWRNPLRRNIQAIYGMIVAQARSPAFYARYGVPDTVQGRFDLIVLHLVLILARLGRNQEPSPGRGRTGHGRSLNLGQGLFDAFCRDLDDNLREMGVGDLAVPRQMRRFGEAFYGRQAAYSDAFVAPDNRELEKALARNIFEAGGIHAGAARLARYARAAARTLDAVEEDALVEAKQIFPNPEAF